MNQRELYNHIKQSYEPSKSSNYPAITESLVSFTISQASSMPDANLTVNNWWTLSFLIGCNRTWPKSQDLTEMLPSITCKSFWLNWCPWIFLLSKFIDYSCCWHAASVLKIMWSYNDSIISSLQIGLIWICLQLMLMTIIGNYSPYRKKVITLSQSHVILRLWHVYPSN